MSGGDGRFQAQITEKMSKTKFLLCYSHALYIAVYIMLCFTESICNEKKRIVNSTINCLDWVSLMVW